jgi:hypothetical protein
VEPRGSTLRPSHPDRRLTARRLHGSSRRHGGP